MSPNFAKQSVTFPDSDRKLALNFNASAVHCKIDDRFLLNCLRLTQ